MKTKPNNKVEEISNAAMAKLVLIRGLPGSGKSTLAKSMTGFVHLEADMFHVDGNGSYAFVPENVKKSHEWCQNTALVFLRNGINVAVSNTFTRKWELAPYLLMKDFCDCTIEIVECTENYGTVHGVPEDKIQQMKDRWEKI